jgi:hypothetical protein
MIHEDFKINRIQGVQLHKLTKQQVITQYVDDTNFTIKASQVGVVTKHVLKLFNYTLGLKINQS